MKKPILQTAATSIRISIDSIENECFVIMPFDGLFQSQYERVIRPAVEAAGLTCVRGDEVFSRPHVMSDIWDALRRCRVVIAELSGRNANVFYELGLAHAVGKPAIIITRSETDVPFDLKALRYVYYDTSDPFWGETLSSRITELVKKVLADEEFGSGLEGIDLESTGALPTAPTQPLASEPAPTLDIAGRWRSEWTLFDVDVEDGVPEHGLFTLSQSGSSISGDIVVSGTWDGSIYTVKETLTGSINGGEVSLQGVSYSFIKRGKLPLYELDTFKLRLDKRGSLRGTISPGADREDVKIVLKRIR
jgi:hypothetical protein